uniref:Uncharacterized protein n=1 Tax=Agrobacterium tumefaciens TaxID=358 RepID=A0A2P0QK18_AGRTU|nr:MULTISPECIES: hypothetical protein [Agrobacterium]ARU12616.1 hypothetical protein AgrTiChry5_211 [Agrobacterium tumefaciens]
MLAALLASFLNDQESLTGVQPILISDGAEGFTNISWRKASGRAVA